jgi:hypothetical protein
MECPSFIKQSMYYIIVVNIVDLQCSQDVGQRSHLWQTTESSLMQMPF